MAQPTGLCKAGDVLFPESSLELTAYFVRPGCDLGSQVGYGVGRISERVMLMLFEPSKGPSA